MVKSLPKNCLLKKSWQYARVYSHGKRLRNSGVNLIFLENDLNQDRLGISISGVKFSVKRNRAKRLVREFFRLNRFFPSEVGARFGYKSGVDLIFAANKRFSPKDIHTIAKVLAPFMQSEPRMPALSYKTLSS